MERNIHRNLKPQYFPPIGHVYIQVELMTVALASAAKVEYFSEIFNFSIRFSVFVR